LLYTSTVNIPLVAAIAKKVEKEKELRKTFEQTVSNKITEEEFVNRTVSLLWLGMRDSNPRSWDQNPVPYRLANPQYKSKLLLLITDWIVSKENCSG
jgi:hypothetical protein